MGLKRMKCKSCKTTYFGNDNGSDDGSCFMCSLVGKLLSAFGLTDLDINEVDFNRVRTPKWEEVHKGFPYVKVKDWRDYIPQGLRGMWDRLPVESRVLAIMFAEREARAVDIVSSAIAKE